MDQLDWNDLRFVMSVAHEGSAAAAGRALGVSHATVMRRVSALERAIGQPLFNRLATGYELTEAGRTLLSAGELTAGAIAEARSMIEGRAAVLAGEVHLTTTDSLARHVVPNLLASFKARFPAINVGLTVTNSVLDLDRREADISLRASMSPPEHWVGVRVARMDFGIYASSQFIERKGSTDWRELDWLFPEGSIAAAPANRWLIGAVSQQRRAASADSFVALQAMARAHIGVTLLPHFMACNEPDLCCIEDASNATSADVWVLTHPNLRHAARVIALMTHLAEGIRAMRGDFERSTDRSRAPGKR
ncbi:LysR family transcriptional regulator [Pseudomonas aeruginosa]